MREATGKNDGRMVSQYLQSTGLREGNPWCAAVIVWTFQEASKLCGVAMTFIRSALANGIYNWAMNTGRKAKQQQVQEGDLIVWKFSRSASGHIGRVRRKINNLWVINDEGNTASGTGNQRDGDGFYQRKRYLGQLGRMALRGYIGRAV
ncbi:MAG: CHAP domain-containing protein [Candidatus Kapabacteria bacterium]|nr:CHAP domain-containing protein [Candidatus Kapabacteria bacterium]